MHLKLKHNYTNCTEKANKTTGNTFNNETFCKHEHNSKQQSSKQKTSAIVRAVMYFNLMRRSSQVVDGVYSQNVTSVRFSC